MIGSNIKKLRVQQGMTQKNLADKLFVSAQAVSRWENNEVEPSVSTIIELAKIFGVSADEIMGIETQKDNNDVETTIEKESTYQEIPRQFLAVCHKCNQPIYESNEIVRKYDSVVWCKSCENKRIANERSAKIEKSIKRRTKSFIISPLLAGLYLWIAISGGGFADIESAMIMILGTISIFTFTSCCLLANNFIGEMTLTIMSWGFVKMPGLIFTLDLDGCLWFLTVKLGLFLLSMCIFLAFALFAFILGLILSVFVYPFAIVKNFKHPEEIEDVF